MPRTPNPPPDNLEQSKRFIEIAREVEADGTKEEFDRVFRKVSSQRPTKRSKGKPQR